MQREQRWPKVASSCLRQKSGRCVVFLKRSIYPAIWLSSGDNGFGLHHGVSATTYRMLGTPQCPRFFMWGGTRGNPPLHAIDHGSAPFHDILRSRQP